MTNYSFREDSLFLKELKTECSVLKLCIDRGASGASTKEANKLVVRADQTLLVKPLLEPGGFYLRFIFLFGGGGGGGCAANEVRGQGRESGKEKQRGAGGSTGPLGSLE